MTLTPNDARLLTPGPLTTALETKQAMLHDWGSRDQAFIEMNAAMGHDLLAIAHATTTHVCVPLQGSGTFVVEAVLDTLIPRNGKALVLVNGAYGQRMTEMLRYSGRAHEVVATPEHMPVDAVQLEQRLTTDPGISHVLVVHCETTAGILNPIKDIAAVVAAARRSLIIDAMSAFGALPLDARSTSFDALMASSNKCLEGVPGMGFALIRQSVLERCQGRAHTLSLDLYDQWRAMERNGQWRFTPPTHVIAAFCEALRAFKAEGGVAARHRRYTENCRILIDGMEQMGFEPLLPPHLQAPIIVTFKIPEHPAFDFQTFYDRVKDRGYVLYPGKLTVTPSFRVGCIGHLGADDMRAAVTAMHQALAEMGAADMAKNSGAASGVSQPAA